MYAHLRPSLTLLLAATLFLGLAYPLGFTALAGALFPHQAGGSLVRVDDRVIGSSLIAQRFQGAGYFHPRPSLAGDGYDAASSGASNLGATNAELLATITERAHRQQALNAGGAVPMDLVTASGSGLDPHISPAAADYQLQRVAAARGLPAERVAELVRLHTEGRDLGVLGEPRVNVLRLNLALDALAAAEG